MTGLRPFFGFYGGKWRDALSYPEPLFSRIIEPFAGSAGYAMRFPAKQVALYDIDLKVSGVWSYLISVDESEILRIPDISFDGSVEDLPFCQEAKWLVGFWLNRGVSSPRSRPSKWMRDGIRPGSFWGERVRQTIASQLKYIRHWKVFNASYEDVPEVEATWFIDPPYQYAGKHYVHGSKGINYKDLAQWCKTRNGQAIVCENYGADWLPFLEHASTKTTRAGFRSREVVWIR